MGREPFFAWPGMTDLELLSVGLVAAHVVVVVLTAVSVSANRRPSTAIAWLLLVIFVPVLGILAFLLVGRGRLPEERREKQRFVTEQLLQRSADDLDACGRSNRWPDWLHTVVTMNRKLGALPMLASN